MLKKLYRKVLKDYDQCQLFSIAGTALGCIRHQDVIPWDDDVDVGMDESNIEVFLKTSKNKGYRIEKASFGYKIIKNNNFIDVFVFTTCKSTGRYMYLSYKARTDYPNEYFKTRSEVYPLVYRKFGNFKIPTPNKLKKYCDRAFPGWDQYVYYNIPHKLSGIEKGLLYVNPFIKKKWRFKYIRNI